MLRRFACCDVWPSLVVLLLSAIGCATDDRAWRGKNQPLIVLIQPLGDVPQRHLDSVRVALHNEHSATVHVAEEVPLPEHAFVTIRSPRYRADTLIAWLKATKPDSVDHVVGITTKDISATKHEPSGGIKEPAWKYTDFGIFGLGYVGGPSCVISTFRLGDNDRPRFFDRLMKIAVHELGHNRALPHCSDTTCVMRDAVERMASIDRAGRGFCGECRKRVSR